MKNMVLIGIGASGVLLTILAGTLAWSQDVGTVRHFLQGADPVPADELQAVGRVPGCTATLIGPRTVLTAAHCVCTGETTPTGCVSASIFTLENVHPVDDPSTPQDESLIRMDVSIPGSVRVHPAYTTNGWLSEDFAVLDLDQPIHEVAVGVQPIPVEVPSNRPSIGDELTLVGFGRTGDDCNSPPAGKRSLTMPLREISEGNVTLRIGTRGSGACPGDSGGPALNQAGNVVGVASSLPGNYDPTYLAYDWIFGIGELRSSIGTVSMLRVHEIESGFGPPTDSIDAEVVFKLASHPGFTYGFSLDDSNQEATQLGMLELLRQAFNADRSVRVEYSVNGPSTGRVVRLILR